MVKVSNSIKKNAGFVNKFLKKELNGNPKQLYDAASHLILHGGKRLRPFLVLKSCQMLVEDNLMQLLRLVQLR